MKLKWYVRRLSFFNFFFSFRTSIFMAPAATGTRFATIGFGFQLTQVMSDREIDYLFILR